MKDYMGRVASLIERYVPPEGSQMQESFQSGKAVLQPSEGRIVPLVFGDYAKQDASIEIKK